VDSLEFHKFCIDHTFKLSVFLDEIEVRAKYAKYHYSSLQQGLSDSSNNMIWISIYSMTIFAAQVSKCLGGSKDISLDSMEAGSKQHQQQSTRLALRLLLDVDDNNPVLDTSLRNRFIHTDEDIDDFFSNGETVVARRNVSHIDLIKLDGANTSQYSFEHFDPSTNELYYRGKKYSLPAIIEGIDDILSNIEKARAKLKEHSESP